MFIKRGFVTYLDVYIACLAYSVFFGKDIVGYYLFLRLKSPIFVYSFFSEALTLVILKFPKLRLPKPPAGLSFSYVCLNMGATGLFG